MGMPCTAFGNAFVISVIFSIVFALTGLAESIGPYVAGAILVWWLISLAAYSMGWDGTCNNSACFPNIATQEFIAKNP
jgi:hypothetical protein